MKIKEWNVIMPCMWLCHSIALWSTVEFEWSKYSAVSCQQKIVKSDFCASVHHAFCPLHYIEYGSHRKTEGMMKHWGQPATSLLKNWIFTMPVNVLLSAGCILFSLYTRVLLKGSLLVLFSVWWFIYLLFYHKAPSATCCSQYSLLQQSAHWQS